MNNGTDERSFRVLHAAVSLAPSIGVIKQMETEALAAEQLAIPWDVRLFSCAHEKSAIVNSVSRGKNSLYSYFSLRTKFYRWLERQARLYDAVLLRYSVHDVLQPLTLLRSKSIWTVHHTLEEAELREIPGVKGRLLSLLESRLSRISLRKCRGTICVTSEISDEQRRRGAVCKALIYPNGILYDSPPALDERSSRLELIFISSALPNWHGLDLLTNEMKRTSKDVRLNLIGPFSPEMIAVEPDDDRFVFHGSLSQNAIRRVAARCDIAISCLALERKGMKEACPLKVREYLRLGIPVFGNYAETSLPTNFPFYRQSRPTLDAIHEFKTALSYPSRELVANMAKPWIDKKVLLNQLYEQLKSICDGESIYTP